MNAKLLLAVMLLIAARFAHAEGGACPPGYYPIGGQGASGCAPIPNYDQSTQAAPAGPRWKTTWGAVAVSSSGTGDVGTSVGKYSKNDAKREAIQKCEAGGSRCKLSLAYHNQCVVIAWASENGEPIGGAIETQSGPGIDVASKHALANCSKARNGGECTIVYSECTKPVQL